MMGNVKEFLLPDRLERWIYYLLFVLALASCVSEPLSRHAARLALVLGMVRLLVEPGILRRLKPYKGFFAAMGSFMLVLTISAIYGGRFYETVTGSTFWYNYNMLLCQELRITFIFINNENT